jgi:membrane-bound hydrogenase subunit beta
MTSVNKDAMSQEETVQARLGERFPVLRDKVRVQRARRLWVDVPQEIFLEVFEYIIGPLEFSKLATITGLDEGETLGLIYHLAGPGCARAEPGSAEATPGGMVLNLHTSVPRQKPVVQTVTSLFPSAEAYEREVVDLLGFQVEGLPEGSRYPLPDDWPAGQYPLRKDWKAESLNPSNVGEGGE